MANSINWVGNPVVGGESAYSPARSYSAPAQSAPTQSAPAQSAPSYSAPAQSARTATQGQFAQGQYAPAPLPVMDIAYIQGYLAQNIGKNVRAEFVLSGNLYMDKAGKLLEVGVNYFVLEDLVSRARIMCDMYSVKFVTTL